MLQLSNITYRIGERTLLDNASVSLPAGARAGLIGRNGVGKTTLFRIITGELPADGGEVSLPRSARIGQVAQEAPAGEESLIDVVLAADKERAVLLRSAETETDPHRIAEIHARLTDIGAHSAEARAASVLNGLGFDAPAQRRPCGSFSGGWRMRVALAAVLFSEPDLLLLDEPTNYLDLEGTLWLSGFLARYRHTTVVISHDRDLLDSAVDTIVHLDQTKLTAYRGGYSQFDRQRRERQALQTGLLKKQQQQRQHLESFVERFRAKATKARQAQSRLKALQRLAPIADMVDERIFPFAIPSPGRPAAPPIIALEGVAVGYDPDSPVLTNLNLSLGNDDRIGLLGKNGNGKSTLARLMSGRLQPLSGSLRRGDKLRVGYFAQHQLDELNPARSAFHHVRDLMPDQSESQVRARAGALGFPAKKMNTPAADLSGGEKARLLLGLAAFGGVDLLILDEPTNHIDIDSREALVHALNDYSGTLVIVSHDRHLIEATVDRFWLVTGGSVETFDGDIDDYRKVVLERPQTRHAAVDAANRSSARDRRRVAAKRRAEAAPLRQKIKKTEALIASLQNQIRQIDAALADPRLYETDSEALTEQSKARASALAELGAAEAVWLALSENLDRVIAE